MQGGVVWWYTRTMPKKKENNLDKPTTRRDLISVTDTMKEIATFIMKEFADFRLEQKLNWEKQWQFNKEISQKVDMNTESIVALDKRVRYQDDLPERLEHVENQQYELTRRVTALEK